MPRKIVQALKKRRKPNTARYLVKAKTYNPKSILVPRRKAEGIMRMFPSVKYTTFEFDYGGGLSSGTTQDNFGTTVDFYLNTLKTPKVSLGAFNVQGYDQLSDVYGNYKVHAVKIDITFSNSTADGMFVGCRVIPHGETDLLTGEALGTSAMKKWTWQHALNNTGSQVCYYSKYWPIYKVESLSKGQFVNDIDNYSSVYTAQPSKLPKILVGCINTANTTDITCMMKIRFTLYTQLYNRKILPSSVA